MSFIIPQKETIILLQNCENNNKRVHVRDGYEAHE